LFLSRPGKDKERVYNLNVGKPKIKYIECTTQEIKREQTILFAM
jgi:hypothetical protein